VLEAAHAVLLLQPSPPMLFMGEEWGATEPFPFFCDFKGDLADAVRNGRRKEFAGAYAKYGDNIPDPLDLSTFQSAVPDWDASDSAAGAARLKLVRELLALRRRHIIPRLAGAQFGEASAHNDGLLRAHWRLGDGTLFDLVANLSDREIAHGESSSAGTFIWGGGLTGALSPWSVHWRLGTP
jgi:1,4-alpha-glucan branching enzyme